MLKLTFLCALALSPLFASPWIPEKGSGSLYSGISFLKAPKVSDAKGDLVNYSITEMGVNLYAEWGVYAGGALSLGWKPLKILRSDSINLIGISDIELGHLQKLVHLGKHRFALRSALIVPSGKANEKAPSFLYALHSQNVWALEFQPQWGWEKHGTWLQGGVGIRLRTEGYAAQGFYAFSGGKNLGVWNPRLGISGLLPLDNKSNGKPSDQEQFYGWHIALDRRMLKTMALGIQFDGMATVGQELPIGLRSNFYFTRKW